MNQQINSKSQETAMRRLRLQVVSIPVVGTGLRALYRYFNQRGRFRSSPSYWEGRYHQGGNSGPGSYGRLAAFKADVINRFVEAHAVTSVVEFGWGDGAQLELAHYPRYTGVDISPVAIRICSEKFAGDTSKKFVVSEKEEAESIKADMAMSLDVIYHLVEDQIYDAYMQRLVHAANRFICVYSSNVELPGHVIHIRHRCFADWLDINAPNWTLVEKTRNAFSYDIKNPDETSWADFYFYGRKT